MFEFDYELEFFDYSDSEEPEVSEFNQRLSDWDTSNVKNMYRMFCGCSAFNQKLNWDTSNVTNMRRMFEACTAFNSPFGENWNTSNVKDMRRMFDGCSTFNQPLNWNTSEVTNMLRMFGGCTKFNQALIMDTSKVRDMCYMFHNCTKFNSPLGSHPFWNTSQVTIMNGMFCNCSTFNQEISFSTRNCTSMRNMFEGTTNMCNQIIMLDTSNVINVAIMFKDSGASFTNVSVRVSPNAYLFKGTGNFMLMEQTDYHTSQYQIFDDYVNYLTTNGHEILIMLHKTNILWQLYERDDRVVATDALNQLIANQGGEFLDAYERAKKFIIAQYKGTQHEKNDNDAKAILERITGVDISSIHQHVTTAAGTHKTGTEKQYSRIRRFCLHDSNCACVPLRF